MARNNRSRNNRRRSGSSRLTTVRFRETLSVVNYSSELVQLHQLIPTAYTWLSPTALSFSEYQVTALSLRWIPAGAATDAGQVVGGFTFDSFEQTPTTYDQLSQLAQHRLSPVSRSVSWRLPTSRLRTRLWPVISASDLASLDVAERAPYLPAIFFFGLRSDRQNGQVAGTLEVNYTFGFSQPDWVGAQAPVVQGSRLRELLDTHHQTTTAASSDSSEAGEEEPATAPQE